MTIQEYDICIIGSGPAAHTAAGSGCMTALDVENYLSSLENI